jgi:hypothetical protein
MSTRFRLEDYRHCTCLLCLSSRLKGCNNNNNMKRTFVSLYSDSSLEKRPRKYMLSCASADGGLQTSFLAFLDIPEMCGLLCDYLAVDDLVTLIKTCRQAQQCIVPCQAMWTTRLTESIASLFRTLGGLQFIPKHIRYDSLLSPWYPAAADIPPELHMFFAILANQCLWHPVTPLSVAMQALYPVPLRIPRCVVCDKVIEAGDENVTIDVFYPGWICSQSCWYDLFLTHAQVRSITHVSRRRLDMFPWYTRVRYGKRSPRMYRRHVLTLLQSGMKPGRRRRRIQARSTQTDLSYMEQCDACVQVTSWTEEEIRDDHAKPINAQMEV